MISMNRKMAFAAMFAAAGIAGAAQAGDVCLTFNGFGASQGVRLFYGGPGFDAADDSAQTFTSPITAGEFLWTNQFGRELTAFCVQVFEGVPAVGTEICFDAVSLTELPEQPPFPGPMSATQSGLMQDMYSRFIDSNTGKVAASSGLGGFAANVAAAAFQTMVWEISHENISEDSLAAGLADLDVSVGAFRAMADGDLASAIATILAELGEGGFRSNPNVFGLTNDDWQDQLVVIPVPAPVLLAGLGLLGAVALRRRMA
jgi:hypothetical protein